jgi:hypothetical protein
MSRRAAKLTVLAVLAVVVTVTGLRALGASSGVLGRLSRNAPAARALAERMAGEFVGMAEAQQILDFKTVPAESSAKFERMRIVRHARATAIRESISAAERRAETLEKLDKLDSSDEPDQPDQPDVPKAVHGRSGSVMRIGSDIVVPADEVVDGDVSSVNGNITVEGHVRGDVVAMRGDVNLKSSARVDGDVVCIGGTLSEDPGAEVSGQRVTAPGSSGWRDFARHEHNARHGDGLAGSLVWLLLMMLFGWILTRFAPGRTSTAVATLRNQTGMAIGIGAMVWALLIPSVIALALVVAILCITIIGIPLALAALVGYFVFIVLLEVWGFVVGCIVLGGVLSHRTSSVETPPPSLVRSAMIGVLALSGACVVGDLLHAATDLGPIHALGTLIIVLAWVASFLAATCGSGALLRAEFVAGTLGRLWAGRRKSSTPAPAPPVPPAPAAAESTGTSGMSPPSAFMPPAPPVPPGTEAPPPPSIV